MTAARSLRLVEPEQPAVDIYAKIAEQRASIDWEKVHIEGDRRSPIDLPETKKRGWLA